jgi:hypothetical protein
LLEVMVALAIFLFALVGLGQLVTLGANQALEVEAKSQAVEMCRSKLNEVACGAVPLGSQSAVPFDEDPDWTWSLDAEQGAVAGLWNVSVTVSRQRPDGSKTECSINQIILDPTVIGTVYDAELIAASNASSSASSSSSSSSSSTGGTSGNNTGSTKSTATPTTSSTKTTTPSTSSTNTTKGG